MTDDVLAAVRELLPNIAERAEQADETGNLPVETIQELRATRVFRMLQPQRYGGLELDPVRFFEVVRAISAHCASTGWVTSILGVHPWQLALFDHRAQDEVWAESADVLLASSYAPVGRLRPVDGGYELTGRWGFSSGCDYSEWALLGAVVVGAEGRPVDFMTVLVPRSDYVIENTWDVVGLRGTASNDIVVDRALVPAHRAMRNYDQAQLSCPGQRTNSGPLYRLPFAAVFTSAVMNPVIGAVSGCYEFYLGRMRDRIRLSLGGGRFAEEQPAQIAVARAAAQLDAAVLQTERNLRALLEYASQCAEIPMELRLRTRRDQVCGTERALEAIDLLFKTAGGNSLQRGNVIERVWRDAHAAGAHVANDADRALAMYGRGAFGLAVEDNLV